MKKQLVKESSQFSLTEDNSAPQSRHYADAFNYTSYSQTLAKHVNATSSEKSFGIAVVGEWGSGKTDFLQRLMSELKSNPENIVFEFNPWRVSNSNAIIEEFFKTLSTKLKRYNRTISAKIREYSARVLQNSKDIKHRLFDVLVNEFIVDVSVDDKYDSINDIIKSTGKRVIIFIDDMDRLTGKEVMEVLRLIRNTANFTNTFFIVGIDQEYIVNVMRNTKDFANEHEYLKKVFQLTITLPVFKKEMFIQEIIKQLEIEKFEENSQKNIINCLKELSSTSDNLAIVQPDIQEDLIERLLNNMRDLKRFCNAFKITFNTGTLKDDADIHDLMILELIKNKSIEVYNGIKNQCFVEDSLANYLNDSYAFSETKWNDYTIVLRNRNFSNAEIDALKDAVKYLFKDEKYKTHRKFADSHNFYIYFSYHLFSIIPMGEYLEVIESDISSIVKKFEDWINDSKEKDKESELKRIAREFINFKNENILKNVINAYLILDAKFGGVFFAPGQWYSIVEKIIFEKRADNNRMYFNNERVKHERFLADLLLDKNILIYYRANLASTFLKEYYLRENAYVDIQQSLILKKEDLAEILYQLFEEYIEIYCQDSIFTFGKLMKFYNLNVDHLENGHLHKHNSKLNEKFREYLISDKHLFEGYTSVVFSKPNMDDGYATYWFEDSGIIEIFGSWEVYKDKLLSIEFRDPDLQTLKKCILKYIDVYFADGIRKKIKVDDEEMIFLKRWWKNIYKQLGLNISRRGYEDD